MTNVELLKKKIADSGLKIAYITENLGISYQGFSRKANGETEFKASEISIMRRLLNLTAEETEEIFFAGNVD